jgi:hypothetical protein
MQLLAQRHDDEMMAMLNGVFLAAECFELDLRHSWHDLAMPVRVDWPKPVLPLGTVCLRVPSPCGA